MGHENPSGNSVAHRGGGGFLLLKGSGSPGRCGTDDAAPPAGPSGQADVEGCTVAVAFWLNAEQYSLLMLVGWLGGLSILPAGVQKLQWRRGRSSIGLGDVVKARPPRCPD